MDSQSSPYHLHASVSRDRSPLSGSRNNASSPRGEQMQHAIHMDRLRCKQDLQKLYEDTLESSYDLSLRDIVDPCYSISGTLKAIATDEEVLRQGQTGPQKNRSWKSCSIPSLSFSFSFPGLRGRSRRRSPRRPNLFASPMVDKSQASSGTRSLKAISSPSNKYATKSSLEATSVSSMSKIHPSNQCSLCSAFTVFFKSRCLVCGRLYCSNCALEHMDDLATGYTCKVPCKNGPLRRRLTQRMAGRCWPF